jgi:hypothetical protein
MYQISEVTIRVWQQDHRLAAGDHKLCICLQLSVSNESVVVLRKVGFNLSGNFSCEVTVEAPSFSTATVYQQMLVVCK